MKTRGSHWNAVVRSYEDSLDLLEAARSEYEDAVRETIAELRAEAEKRLEKLDRPQGIELDALTEDTDEEFAQQWLHCTVRAAGLEWATVHAWVASPFGGTGATLRVGIEAKQNPEVVRADWVRSAWADLKGQGLDTLSAKEREIVDWVFVENVDLGSPTWLGAGAHALAHAVETCVTRAATLAERAAPMQRALDGLRALRRKLEREPLVKGQKLDPKTKELSKWDGTMHFTLCAPGAPSVWVAVDPGRRELIYAHDADHDGALAARVGERIGVVPSERIGFPSGVLLGEQALVRASEPDIAASGEKALRAFVELTSKTK